MFPFFLWVSWKRGLEAGNTTGGTLSKQEKKKGSLFSPLFFFGLDFFKKKKKKKDEDQDFTLGKRFPQPKMKAFVDKLHASGQRWVPILDPVIHVRKGYKPYDDGMSANVFLNDQTGHPYVAQLWPGASHLPDFMHPNASSWWKEQLRSVIEEEGLGIDGIWLDMNEVSDVFLKNRARVEEVRRKE